MKWTEIVEYIETKEEKIERIKRKALEYAMNLEQMCFSLVDSENTGLPYTIYVSSCKEYPVIIIDSRPGRNIEPDINSKVLLIGEKSKDSLLDDFLTKNLNAIKKQNKGKKYGYPNFINDLK
jgi:hypothetical protein